MNCIVTVILNYFVYSAQKKKLEEYDNIIIKATNGYKKSRERQGDAFKRT